MQSSPFFILEKRCSVVAKGGSSGVKLPRSFLGSPLSSCEVSLGLNLLTYKIRKRRVATLWVLFHKILHAGLLLRCPAYQACSGTISHIAILCSIQSLNWKEEQPTKSHSYEGVGFFCFFVFFFFLETERSSRIPRAGMSAFRSPRNPWGKELPGCLTEAFPSLSVFSSLSTELSPLLIVALCLTDLPWRLLWSRSLVTSQLQHSLPDEPPFILCEKENLDNSSF